MDANPEKRPLVFSPYGNAMTVSAARLNDRYGLPGEVEFRDGPDGLVFAEVQNDLAKATLCLQGAHLTTWRPRSQQVPVVWISAAAQYAARKSIRGGIPLCWPGSALTVPTTSYRVTVLCARCCGKCETADAWVAAKHN